MAFRNVLLKYIKKLSVMNNFLIEIRFLNQEIEEKNGGSWVL